MYQLLGLVAAFCNKTSRQRVNGMAGYLWVMVMLAMILGFGVMLQLRDRSAYGKPPASATVASLFTEGADNRYVTVAGPLDFQDALTETSDNSTDTYVPMVDPTTRQAILVRISGSANGGSNAGQTTVTGMVRDLDEHVESTINSGGGTLGKYTVNVGMAIDAGESPTNPEWFLLTLALAGPPFLLLLGSMLMKHIVFQRLPHAPPRISQAGATGTPIDTIPVQGSGKLTLSPKIAQRFLEMPVVVTQTESGELIIASRIDASISTSRGFINRAGLWAAVIKPGTLNLQAKGRQFLGIKSRPAIAVSFTDQAGRKEANSAFVLSFDNDEDRDAMWDELQKPQPTLSPKPQAAKSFGEGVAQPQ